MLVNGDVLIVCRKASFCKSATKLVSLRQVKTWKNEQSNFAHILVSGPPKWIFSQGFMVFMFFRQQVKEEIFWYFLVWTPLFHLQREQCTGPIPESASNNNSHSSCLALTIIFLSSIAFNVWIFDFFGKSNRSF